MPDTLSNYLDLAYLRWYAKQPDAPMWVTVDEVEIAMQNYAQSLREEHDAKTIESHRAELFALMESKHLLDLYDVDKLFVELADAIL
ncbi:MAG: hypothetical protein Q8Q23_03975 [bacterium]|nr:hypothetical protein [bacterium]